MSQHDDLVRLRHMLDNAQEALELIQGRKRRDLDTHRLLELSLIRLMETLGEAANRVSPTPKLDIAIYLVYTGLTRLKWHPEGSFLTVISSAPNLA